MTSPITDRASGTIGSAAIKAPCRVATSAAITLSGLQTIDGVALAAGDRVLVKDQADQVDNGIWLARSSTWARAADFDGAYDAVNGTVVYVRSGAAGQGFWYCTAIDTIAIGTDAITFGRASSVLAVVSAFAQTLLDDADAAASRSTLGIGDGPTFLATLGLANGLPSIPQARLTLTTGVAATTSDVTAATTVYVTPVGGQCIPVWTGSAFFPYALSADLSLALDSASGHTGYHQSGKNFYLFAFLNGGVLDIGTGPAWSSDTSVGTGAGTSELELKGGIYVNKNAITLRTGSASGDTVAVAAEQATLVGGFRASADGQTEDSATKRFVWSAYNGAIRNLARSDPAASWSYSTAAWRQRNANAANKVEWFVGLDGAEVEATANAIMLSSTTTVRTGRVGIGLDSTTVNGATLTGIVSASSTGALGAQSEYAGCPGAGYHYLAALEYGDGNDTQTWFGTSATAGLYKTGIKARVIA